MVTFSESSRSFIKLFYLLPFSETFAEASISKYHYMAFVAETQRPKTSSVWLFCLLFYSLQGLKKGKEKKKNLQYEQNNHMDGITWISATERVTGMERGK